MGGAGEGKGRQSVPPRWLPHPPAEETGVRPPPRGAPCGPRGPGCRGEGGAAPPPPACAPSVLGAQRPRAGGAGRACVRWERASRPAPPPTLPGRPLRASPAARALPSGEAAAPARPRPHPFTPVSPRPCRAPVRTPPAAEGPACTCPPPPSVSLPTPKALPANCRAARRLFRGGRGASLCPGSLCLACSILLQTGGLGVDPSGPLESSPSEARDLPYCEAPSRLSTL